MELATQYYISENARLHQIHDLNEEALRLARTQIADLERRLAEAVEALTFYRDEWTFRTPTWAPTKRLREDRGNRATAVLAGHDVRRAAAVAEGGADASTTAR